MEVRKLKRQASKAVTYKHTKDVIDAVNVRYGITRDFMDEVIGLREIFTRCLEQGKLSINPLHQESPVKTPMSITGGKAGSPNRDSTDTGHLIQEVMQLPIAPLHQESPVETPMSITGGKAGSPNRDSTDTGHLIQEVMQLPIAPLHQESPVETPMSITGGKAGSRIHDLVEMGHLSQEVIQYKENDLLTIDINAHFNNSVSELPPRENMTEFSKESPDIDDRTSPERAPLMIPEETATSIYNVPDRDDVYNIPTPKTVKYTQKGEGSTYTFPPVSAKHAIDNPRRLLHREVIIGALHTEEGYLIQVGAVEIVNKKIQSDVFSMYFDPGEVNLDAKIINNYGITHNFLKKHRTVKNSLKFFLDFINDAHILTHSECFSMRIFNNMLTFHGFTVLSLENVKPLDSSFNALQHNATLTELSGLDQSYNNSAIFNNSITGCNLIDDVRLVSLIYINTKWDLYGISFTYEGNLLSCNENEIRKHVVQHESPAQSAALHKIINTPESPYRVNTE